LQSWVFRNLPLEYPCRAIVHFALPKGKFLLENYCEVFGELNFDLTCCEVRLV